MSKGPHPHCQPAHDRLSINLAGTGWDHWCVSFWVYILSLLMFLADVLLICPTTHRSAISHHIHSDTSSSSYPSLRVDLQTFDESEEFSPGTCAILRHFSSRIQKDFILLPCDLVPPESLPLTTLLTKFRIESNVDGSIMTSCWFEGSRPDKSTVPEEWGSSNSITPIIWEDHLGTLLHVDTLDDADRNSEELEIRMALLSKYVLSESSLSSDHLDELIRYPKTNLSSHYQDSHVYICRRAVLDVLQQKPGFESFREEFVPWLCKLHYQRTRHHKYSRGKTHFLSLPCQNLNLWYSPVPNF